MEVASEISSGLNTGPAFYMHMEAYHYETSTDSKGRKRRRKVVTNTGSMNYEYTQYKDESDPLSSLYYLQALQLTRLDMKKSVKFTTHSIGRYSQTKGSFITVYNTDTHYKYSENRYIDGYTDKVLVHAFEDGDLPWYANPNLLRFLDVIRCGCVQRLALLKETFMVEYRFRKIIIQ